MRLLIVAHEAPYPPTHGGRADMWRRIRALRAQGHSLMVVAWTYQGRGQVVRPEDTARLEAECERAIVLPIDQTPAGFARRIPHLLHWPSHAAARVLSPAAYRRVRAAAAGFAPDAVLLDGYQGAWLARRLQGVLDKPLLYRAHNREFAYLAGQRALAPTWKARLGLAVATLHLRRVETALHRDSARVLDISGDDLAWWRDTGGFTNGVWLPPLADPDLLQAPPVAPDQIVDLAYLGNLRTPNNVHGVLWFLDEVLPRLRRVRPALTVLIGGSEPTAEIRERCRAAAVTLEADVAAPSAVLGRGRVLINPIWMSSGVNIKMIDMAVTGAPVVTTPPGLAGLPSEARALFEEAADAEAFAAQCDRLLRARASDRKGRRDLALRWFGEDALRRVMDSL